MNVNVEHDEETLASTYATYYAKLLTDFLHLATTNDLGMLRR